MNPSHTGEMPAPKGYVSISIDADPATHPSNAIQLTPRQFEQSTLLLDQLAERFEHYRVPASWALQNPAKNPLAERLAKSPLPHEISLLADAVLANREVTRSDLLQSIVRPLQSATESGFRLSTLAVPYAWQPRHVDLLTKYGFTMIRTPHVFSSQTTSGVRAVCYGLWQVPVSAVLHGSRWMASLGQWRLMRRAIDRTMQFGGWCHVRIDAASLATGDIAVGIRMVGRLLQHAHQLRSAGQMAIETLHDAAIRLTPKRSGTAAHSILRAA